MENATDALSSVAPFPISISHFIALAVAAAILSFFQPYFAVQKDRREPPLLHASVPLIGHLIELFRKGADYFLELEQRYHQGLYLLFVGKGRMYIVASPEWAQTIHRAHKSLQFNTLVSQAMKNIFCLDDRSMAILKQNQNAEDGTRSGLMQDVHHMLGTTLAPGELVDEMNRSVLDTFCLDIDALAKGRSDDIQLWSWLRHHFSVAAVTALWGPKNPLVVHPDVEAAFWDFEANILQLSMVPMPRLLTRKGWNGRQRLFDTFTEYFDQERYNEPGVNQIIKDRVELIVGQYGWSKRMHAQGEVSFVFAAVTNAVPTVFWMISYIYSDKTLLSELRKEVDNCINSSLDSPKRTINANLLRTSCPLLLSTFRETLRVVGSVHINRYVAEDVSLTNSATGETYLLKKDSLVQIASNVIHQNSLWGGDALEFNPRRFMQSNDKARSDASPSKIPDPAAPFRDEKGKVYSAAFRSFGGGNNVCPGRHFAQMEILALASLFVAGFEIEGADSPGKYEMPPFEDFKLGLGVIKPARDVSVKISRRAGYEDVEWAFEM
jgi:cytochrome P450